jgi:hypothetical protein
MLESGSKIDNIINLFVLKRTRFQYKISFEIQIPRKVLKNEVSALVLSN